MRLLLLLAAFVSLIVLSVPSVAQPRDRDAPDPRSVSIPKAEIDDEFFAFVVGLLANDVEARYDLEALLTAFPEYDGADEGTPIYRLTELSRIRRANDPRGSSYVTVQFDADFEYPIPVDFLGYHPGEVEVSAVVIFAEQSFSRLTVSTDRRDAVDLSPLYVLRMVAGRLFIDFDGLVDVLAFAAFDDLDAKTILIFRYRSDWYAVLAGEGHRGRIHEWTFNLADTTFMRRPPRPLRGIADQFVEFTE